MHTTLCFLKLACTILTHQYCTYVFALVSASTLYEQFSSGMYLCLQLCHQGASGHRSLWRDVQGWCPVRAHKWLRPGWAARITTAFVWLGKLSRSHSSQTFKTSHQHPRTGVECPSKDPSKAWKVCLLTASILERTLLVSTPLKDQVVLQLCFCSARTVKPVLGLPTKL